MIVVIGEQKTKRKAMISQPMAGLTEQEIEATRALATDWLKKDGFEVIDTYFTDNDPIFETEEQKRNPVFLLAKSIEAMSKVDSVYFCKGWEKSRGCQVEHLVAEKYGLCMYYM